VGRLPTESRVLDCGCGNGVPIDRYLVGKGLSVTGIDISGRQVALARQNVPGARFLHGDYSRHDFRRERFDGIVATYSIFHLPRREHRGVFRRLHDLLDDGGVLLATLGTTNTAYEEDPDWCGAPMAWSAFEPGEYREILASAGFAIFEERFEGKPGDDEYHLWVLAARSSARSS
jgi:SAM-dependent methyltransferase